MASEELMHTVAKRSLVSLLLFELIAALIYVGGLEWRKSQILSVYPPQNFQYSDMALNLERAKAFNRPDFRLTPNYATHPPGIQYLLAWLYKHDPSLDNATLLQFGVSALIPLAVAYLGFLSGGRRVAALALIFSSLYFPFIEYGSYFLTEIYVTFLLPLFLAFLLHSTVARSRAKRLVLALLSGFMLSLLIAFKTYFLVSGAVCLGMFLLAYRQTSRKLRLISLGVCCLGMLPGVVVAAQFCTEATGRLCIGSSKFGADFLMSHYGRGGFFTWTDPATREAMVFQSPSALQRGFTDHKTLEIAISDNRANLELAWDWTREHPMQSFLQSVEQVNNTFVATYPWPASGSPQYLLGMGFHYFYLLFLLLPSILLLRDRGRGLGVQGFLSTREALLASPIFGIIICVMLATGEARYRIPFDSILVVFASMFFVSLFTASGPQEPRQLPPT